MENNPVGLPFDHRPVEVERGGVVVCWVGGGGVGGGGGGLGESYSGSSWGNNVKGRWVRLQGRVLMRMDWNTQHWDT